MRLAAAPAGTLHRNPDIKWRQQETAIAELSAKQRSILSAAARLPKIGGRLVYATCSLLVEENEAVVEAFLAERPNWKLIDGAEMLRQAGVPFAETRRASICSPTATIPMDSSWRCWSGRPDHVAHDCLARRQQSSREADQRG